MFIIVLFVVDPASNFLIKNEKPYLMIEMGRKFNLPNLQ